MRRRAAVAGMFYAGDEQALLREIEATFLDPLGPGRLPVVPDQRIGNVLGVISPHAGYAYSGYGAASAFHALAEDGLPDVAVILGPNHYGVGEPVAIVEQGIWETPIGDLRVDDVVGSRLINALPYIRCDVSAHVREHSLEVQAPFLRYMAGDRVKIVPLSIGFPAVFEMKPVMDELGEAIALALEGLNGVVIASTDMTHYESRVAAQRKDAAAIQAIESLDSSRLIEAVNREGISMCGAAPAAIAIEACRRLGAVKAELLRYYTSGDVTGDTTQVVGYAAMEMVRG